jgi:malate dehydrogenase (oxaloacetate-decarboxylating)
MADDAIVLALANPDPEVDPLEAGRHAAVVGTGRSDFPNQINNVLAFPGFFRGMLDAGAREITREVMLAAAQAIADCVHPSQLNASFIVPSVFDPAVAPSVAAAVREAATRQGNAAPVDDLDGAPSDADDLGAPTATTASATPTAPPTLDRAAHVR